MNENADLEVLEQELLSNTQNCFKISFSTHSPNANIEILEEDSVIKQYVHGSEEIYDFYSKCEEVADFESIEIPFP